MFDKLPKVLAKVTGIPAPRAFPFSSLTVALRTLVATLFARIEVGEAVRLMTCAVFFRYSMFEQPPSVASHFSLLLASHPFPPGLIEIAMPGMFITC
ncbi:hypothetical protein D3C77_653210 [compost metagenome]